MYKLTIIISHYESVTTLEKLMHSIPVDDNIQVIVVDDHSRKHKEQWESFKKQYANRALLLENQYGKGAGGCRNTGLKYARGEWLLFADDDDYFVNNFYQIIMSNLYDSSEDLIIFTPTSEDINTGEPSDRHHMYKEMIDQYLQNSSKDNENRIRYRFSVPWSKLIRTKIVKENNILFEEVISSNDVMFSTQVGYIAKEFKVSKECIYCVTKNSGSLTTQISEKVYDSRVDVFIRYYTFLKEKLSINEFEKLELSGRTYLVNGLRYNIPPTKLWKTFLKFRRNKIIVFESKLFNPIFFFKKVIDHYKEHKKEKEYYSD